MIKTDLENKLHELLKLPSENELVEFKEARTDFDKDKIGKYFSALSNEANLHRKSFAWLIFGVNNKHHIVGTNYKNQNNLQTLKHEIAQKISNTISFIDIYELNIEDKRVIMFQIPPAPKGIPISYDGHYYARNHESLVSLNIEKIERIRNQVINFDWTKEIILYATINDLDENALKKARIEFIKRNPKYEEEIESWNDSKFLDKAKLTIKGKITRACFILLGKEQEEHFLDSVVKIRWNLKTISNQDKDYEIFSIPFLLAIDEVYNKIRNLKYRYLQDGTLFPTEVLRYDPFVIREPLNNAIAHQDYSKKSRINVVEFEDDHLVFSNYGSFIPNSVEEVVLRDSPEEKYRNPFLVEAMRNLGMIETQGGGIRKVFTFQSKRFFPLPEYDFSNEKVKVTITGKIINEEFAKILFNNPDVYLEEIILLDKVQKQIPITEEEFKYLKKKHFIEGRKPNVFLSYKVIEPTNDSTLKAEYTKNKAFNDKYYLDLIFKYIFKYKEASRKDINILLSEKLSNILNEKQKTHKINNLLQVLRKEKKIEQNKERKWILKN